MKASTVKNRQSAIKKSNAKNEAGAPAFKLGDEDRLIQVLTCGVLENTFYVKADDLFDQFSDIFTGWTEKDPELLAKAIVFARNEGLMRSVPVMALAHLSKQDTKGKEKVLFKAAFRQTIKTPKDLLEFVSYVREGEFRGLGNAIDKAVSEWLQNLSEYHAIKYGSDSQGLSMRDLLRLVRPNPTKFEPAQQVLFKWLVDKDKVSAEDLTVVPQLACYETFKKDKDLTKALEGRLPYEVITAIDSSDKAWEVMFQNAPIMNLIRNLRNFAKRGVLKRNANVDKVIAKLTDKESIARSKQFPFRFFSAIRELEHNSEFRGLNRSDDILDALNTALELSVANVPPLPGKTFLSMDCSGSMHSPLSHRSSLKYIDVGSIFGALLVKLSSSNVVTGFANDCKKSTVRRSDSVTTIAERIAHTTSGGTNLSSPLEYMIQHKIKADQAILITDEESWIEDSGHKNYWGWGWQSTKYKCVGDAIKDYHQKVQKDTKFFMIRLDPYPTSQTPKGQKNVFHVSGWSDAVVKFISMTAHGASTQLQEVEKVQLDK